MSTVLGVDVVRDNEVVEGGSRGACKPSRHARPAVLCQGGQVGAATAGQVDVTTQASVLESESNLE